MSNKLPFRLYYHNHVTGFWFRRARKIMGDYLRGNEDLRTTYQANVAMLLHDRYGITDHKERNQAADDILSLIFQ